ncbi:MATE family efflux transporter [Secundilactobacillus collinoides]
MIATIFGTVLTIVLDPIFLFVCHWGATGVGLANVIGYVLNTSLLVYFMQKRAKVLTLAWSQAHATRKTLLATVSIGIPASLTNFMASFGTMLLNNYLARYGADAVAAMGIANKIYMMIMLVMVGFAFGAQPLIGYNYGSGNRKRLNAILRFDYEVLIGYSLVLGVILMILAPHLVALFMNQATIVSMGTLMLRALLATTPLMGAILVFTTVFQSFTKPISALIMAVARQGVIFAVVIIFLSKAAGFNGVVWSQAVSDCLTFLIGVVLFYRAMHARRKTA